MECATPEALPAVVEAGVEDQRGPPIEGFTQFSFAAGGFVHAVYHAGRRSDPVVLVLQELPGIAPGLLQFAGRLVAAGFQVYLPWLFGAVGSRTPMRNFARLCISREFANLRAGVSAPVTQWLRALVSHVSAHNRDGLVGVIGMCVTGGFAIPLLLNPRVAVAVAAQPAIPLSLRHLAFGSGGTRRQAALNVAQADLEGVRARLATGEVSLLAVRCVGDRLCPPERLRRLEREFPVGLSVREYGKLSDRNALGERPHATYTKEYRLAPAGDLDHLAHQAFEELVRFLDGGLRTSSA
jgi:dienelactone hydrolase